MSASSIMLSMLLQNRREQQKLEKEKETLLTDPAKLDKIVGGRVSELSPSFKIPSKAKHGSLSAAAEASIPDDHPMKGFSTEYATRLKAALAHPESRGHSVSEISSALAGKLLLEPAAPGRLSRLEESYQYKRKADSSWFSSFGMDGEDESVKKPIGYDEWKQAVREGEDEDYNKLSWTPTKEGLAKSAGIGAVIGGALASPLGVTAPAGAATGALSGLAFETIQAPWSKIVAGSEWARARMNTGSAMDKVAVLGAEFIPTLAAGWKSDKAAMKMFTVAGELRKAATVVPTAENVIKAAKAGENAEKSLKRGLGMNPEFWGKYEGLWNKMTGKGAVAAPEYTGTKALVPVDKSEFADFAEYHFKKEPPLPRADYPFEKEPTLLQEGRSIIYSEAPGVTERGLVQSAAKAVVPIEEGAVSRARSWMKDAYDRYLADTIQLPANMKMPVTIAGTRAMVPAYEAAPIRAMEWLRTAREMQINPVAREAIDTVITTGHNGELIAEPIISSVAERTAVVAGKRAGRIKKVKAKTPIEAVDSSVIPEFKTTGEAITFGKTATPDQITALASRRAELSEETRKLVADDKLQEAMEVATRSQFARESWEAANGIFPKVKAPVLSVAEEEVANVLPAAEKAAVDTIVKKRKVATEVGTKLQRNIAPTDVDDVDGISDDVVAKLHDMKAKGIPFKYNPKTGKVSVLKNNLDKKLAEELAPKWQPYSYDEALTAGKTIIKDFDAGTINAKEAQQKTLDLIESVQTSPKLSGVDRTEILDGAEKAAAHFGRKAALLGFFALTAGSVSMFEMFQPETAEAGIISFLSGAAKIGDNVASEAAQAGVKVKGIEMLRKMRSTGLIVDKITAPDVYHIPKNGFQRGLWDSAFGGPSQIIKHATEWVKNPANRSAYKLMSPYQVAEAILGVGKNNLGNPAVHKASYFMAEVNNIKNSQQVVRNILQGAGIKSENKAIEKLFEPLLPGMKAQIEHDFHMWKVDITASARKKLMIKAAKLTERGKPIPKDYAKDIAILDQKVSEHAAGANALKQQMSEYHMNYGQVAQQAAEQFPEARIFYALDDTPGFKKYPFLKNVTFSPEEQLTIDRLRKQLGVYKERLTDLKVKTMDEPYVHYSLHKGFDFNRQELLGSDFTRNAYTKFYSRTKNSRPLVPDIARSMGEYVYDVEKRLQTQGFWKQGWDKVEKKFAGFPAVADVFKHLREGTVPHEKTWGRTAMNAYSQFEIFRNLFLNPSAGGKHLCKVFGDVVSRGLGEVAAEVPGSIKNVMWRAADMIPQARKTLSNLGITGMNEQEKLYKSWMDSLIPVQTHHQRLLNMGIVARDSDFDTIKNVWNTAEKTWAKTQGLGAAWINLAELVDRGLSARVGLSVAAKKGMTIEQGYYGALDLILKNNFLGREFNPSWLNKPMWRALFMFQTTPFKILERRVVNAMRASKSIKTMGKEIYALTKSPEGRAKLWTDLRDLRGAMKREEQEWKANVFIDALRTETDFFGSTMVSQAAKDILVTGAALTGGAYAGVNLKHHFFHVPFLSGYTNEPTLNFSPGVMGTIRGYHDWLKREEYDDEFLFTKIAKQWMGPSGPIPSVFRKMSRLSTNDIPEIYKDSKFQYLFAIPSKEK